MTTYRVKFVYGKHHLWTDVEGPQLTSDDRRGFADMAQTAVKIALEANPQIERDYIAHDYVIDELEVNPNSAHSAKIVYSFDSLANE